MGKKVKEYKSGDFIFAKVKGYPAWPARVQRVNGKKYFVYFYGTGEIANLPPNMIFDYSENKDKFLTKSVKRRDFNDGVKQIEYDFANNVPLEQVVGISMATSDEAPANNSLNDTTANDTADDSMAVDTTVDETINDESTTQKEGGVEDSDDTGSLVIDESKAKGRKSTAKTPAKETKETPKAKEPKTPRGRGKKEDTEDTKEDEKKEEEIVSRSGRKIRPKRYADEQTEENTALPSPAAKKKRANSPQPTEKDKEKDKDKEPKDKVDKNIKYNTVPQSEIEDLKEPFVPGDGERDNILIVYLPSGQYAGIKLFQSRPASFKNEAAKLSWDKQSAGNAIRLKQQLERGQITAQSVLGQLVMDLNLTDEEKATLDKERETEEKKSRVQFLKTEMKLIELDARIKTCLCLEKADTELCLKLLDELMELDIKPLMLLKHPSCLETVKRMRAYVGNTPSWDLKEEEVLVFSQHAHRIRKQADIMYGRMKDLFTTPEGLTFWEFFMERVSQFKNATSKLTADELLELVHEPLEMTVPTSHTMRASIDAANEEESIDEDGQKKKTAAKTKKPVNSTPAKQPVKRQNSKKQDDKKQEESKKEDNNSKEKDMSSETADVNNKSEESSEDKEANDKDAKDKETKDKDTTKDKEVETKANDKSNESAKIDSTEEEKTQDPKKTEKKSHDSKKEEKKQSDSKKDEKKTHDSKKDDKKTDSKKEDKKTDSKKEDKKTDSKKEDKKTESKKEDKKSQESRKEENSDTDKKESKESSKDKAGDKKDSKESSKEKVADKKDSKEGSKEKSGDKKDSKDSSKEKVGDKEDSAENSEQSDKDDKGKEKDKQDDEPKAKRSRESKKTEPPPPRSPTKRKSKA